MTTTRYIQLIFCPSLSHGVSKRVACWMTMAAAIILFNGSAAYAEENTSNNDPTLEYKISVPVDGEEVEVSGIALFRDQYAISVLSGVDEEGKDIVPPVVFDLANESWYDFEVKRWVTKKEWKRSIDAAAAKFKSSLSRLPAGPMTEFMKETLEPSLGLSAKDGELLIEGSAVSYRIAPLTPTSKGDLDRFIAYDKLSGAHKSVTLKQLPPYVQWQVDDIMKRENVMPKRMTATVDIPSNKQVFTIDLSFREATEEDSATTEKLIAALPPQAADVEKGSDSSP